MILFVYVHVPLRGGVWLCGMWLWWDCMWVSGWKAANFNANVLEGMLDCIFVLGQSVIKNLDQKSANRPTDELLGP